MNRHELNIILRKMLNAFEQSNAEKTVIIYPASFTRTEITQHIEGMISYKDEWNLSEICHGLFRKNSRELFLMNENHMRVTAHGGSDAYFFDIELNLYADIRQVDKNAMLSDYKPRLFTADKTKFKKTQTYIDRLENILCAFEQSENNGVVVVPNYVNAGAVLIDLLVHSDNLSLAGGCLLKTNYKKGNHRLAVVNESNLSIYTPADIYLLNLSQCNSEDLQELIGNNALADFKLNVFSDMELL